MPHRWTVVNTTISLFLLFISLTVWQRLFGLHPVHSVNPHLLGLADVPGRAPDPQDTVRI